MGLIIYLDDLKSSSVVVRESANSFKDKLEKAITEATEKAHPGKIFEQEFHKPAEPVLLELQGWHKSPCVIMKPLEHITYFVEQPDSELKEMMDHQREMAKQRRQISGADPKIFKPN